jgi:O-antigen ligase
MADHALQPRAAAPLFQSAAPIAAAGLLAAAVVGIALAVNLRLGAGGILALTYGPVALLNLPLSLVIWLPTAFVSRLPVVGLASTAMLIIFALAWFGAMPERQREVREAIGRHRGLLALLALMLTWFALSLLWGSDNDRGAHELPFYAIVGATFVLVMTTLTSRRYVTFACGAFVIGAVISVAAGLIPGTTDRFEFEEAEVSRLAGALGDPNFLASGLVPAMALAAGLMGTTRSPAVRTTLIAAIAVLAIGVGLSGSRGGLVAAVVVVGAALMFGRGRRLQLGALILLVIAIGGLWTAGTSPQSWDRIRDFETDTGRQDLWTIAWRMAEDNVVTGVGVGSFRAESAAYVRRPGRLERADLVIKDDPAIAHNVYLQILAETGVIGAALFLGVLAGAVRASWVAATWFDAGGDARSAALARAVLVAQVGMLSASMFMSNGYDSRLWILLALGPAMATVAARGLERAR